MYNFCRDRNSLSDGQMKYNQVDGERSLNLRSCLQYVLINSN